MGLDMFFTGRRYLWDFGDGDQDRIAAVAKVFPEAAGARINEVTAEFQYWRKANQIHRWFVDNVQDGVDECQETFVPIEKLYELRDVCAAVMADRSQAATLLPAQSGFFFGGTEYDEYYFSDVERTLKWLDGLLTKQALAALKGWDFYYQASW
jgi:hypothetical protein